MWFFSIQKIEKTNFFSERSNSNKSKMDNQMFILGRKYERKRNEIEQEKNRKINEIEQEKNK